jgi:hypothetical protein
MKDAFFIVHENKLDIMSRDRKVKSSRWNDFLFYWYLDIIGDALEIVRSRCVLVINLSKFEMVKKL